MADLRTKLAALVEALRSPLDPDEDKNDRYWLGWNDCLDSVLRDFAALLAESEPEHAGLPNQVNPCGHRHMLPPEDCPDCEAKAKLPLEQEEKLRHEFVRRPDWNKCVCGWPRSAHEAK